MLHDHAAPHGRKGGCRPAAAPDGRKGGPRPAAAADGRERRGFSPRRWRRTGGKGVFAPPLAAVMERRGGFRTAVGGGGGGEGGFRPAAAPDGRKGPFFPRFSPFFSLLDVFFRVILIT